MVSRKYCIGIVSLHPSEWRDRTSFISPCGDKPVQVDGMPKVLASFLALSTLHARIPL
jgi:hypothetical protein